MHKKLCYFFEDIQRRSQAKVFHSKWFRSQKGTICRLRYHRQKHAQYGSAKCAHKVRESFTIEMGILVLFRFCVFKTKSNLKWVMGERLSPVFGVFYAQLFNRFHLYEKLLPLSIKRLVLFNKFSAIWSSILSLRHRTGSPLVQHTPKTSLVTKSRFQSSTKRLDPSCDRTCDGRGLNIPNNIYASINWFLASVQPCLVPALKSFGVLIESCIRNFFNFQS